MKAILKYLKNYKLECVMAPLFKLLEALIELFIPYVILDMINNGINKDDAGHIWLCVLLLVVMGLVGLAFSLTAQYFSAKAAVGFTARVRGVLFRHIQHLSYKNVDSIGKSTLINRLTSDMNQVQTGINLTLRLFLRSPFIVFGAALVAGLIYSRKYKNADCVMNGFDKLLVPSLIEHPVFFEKKKDEAAEETQEVKTDDSVTNKTEIDDMEDNENGTDN